MTKKFASITLIIALTVAVFSKPLYDVIWPEKPISKEISLAIAADEKYTAAVYENSSATVHVWVIKVRGNTETIVWDKNFDSIELQKYPSLTAAITEEVTIPKIYDSKEKLYVTYTVTYNTRGSIIQVADGAIVPNGMQKDKLFINI